MSGLSGNEDVSMLEISSAAADFQVALHDLRRGGKDVQSTMRMPAAVFGATDGDVELLASACSWPQAVSARRCWNSRPRRAFRTVPSDDVRRSSSLPVSFATRASTCLSWWVVAGTEHEGVY